MVSESSPTVCYLDTSAAMKLLIEESESAALVEHLAGGSTPRRVVSSMLLHTELHCAAGRHPKDIDLRGVNEVLATVDLFDLTRGDLLGAALHAPLRSHDAIHLTVALRVGVDEIATYDHELQQIAERAGLAVLAPVGG